MVAGCLAQSLILYAEEILLFGHRGRQFQIQRRFSFRFLCEDTALYQVASVDVSHVGQLRTVGEKIGDGQISRVALNGEVVFHIFGGALSAHGHLIIGAYAKAAVHVVIGDGFPCHVGHHVGRLIAAVDGCHKTTAVSTDAEYRQKRRLGGRILILLGQRQIAAVDFLLIPVGRHLAVVEPDKSSAPVRHQKLSLVLRPAAAEKGQKRDIGDRRFVVAGYIGGGHRHGETAVDQSVNKGQCDTHRFLDNLVDPVFFVICQQVVPGIPGLLEHGVQLLADIFRKILAYVQRRLFNQGKIMNQLPAQTLVRLLQCIVFVPLFHLVRFVVVEGVQHFIHAFFAKCLRDVVQAETALPKPVRHAQGVALNSESVLDKGGTEAIAVHRLHGAFVFKVPKLQL